jgi:hypothetical protein
MVLMVAGARVFLAEHQSKKVLKVAGVAEKAVEKGLSARIELKTMVEPSLSLERNMGSINIV